MQRCDLIVSPSRRESFGLVLLEAGALGKPVIATRVGGVPEVVMDNETGVLVRPEDPAALAAAIIKLLENRDLAHRMGMNARRRVEERFTIQHAVSQVLEVYYSVLVGS